MMRRIITGLFVAVVSVVLIVPLSAATALKGYVTDEIGVLSQDTIQRMTVVSDQLKTATGVELATYVPKTMGDAPIEMFAEETFAASKIGEKGKDNGILFVVALNERKLRIEVGYGLEGILPDGRAGDIIRQVVMPRIKAKQIEVAIEAGHEAIASHIAAQNGVKLDGVHTQYQSQKTAPHPLFILILLIVVAIVVARGGGGGLLGFILGMMVGGGGGGNHRGGGFGGGGFGGFGGGSSGGGGASGSW